MFGTVHIFSSGAEHTTARYFERVLQNCACERVVYQDSAFDITQLRADDLLFFIDPAPAWPLGLEQAPCTTVAYLIDVHQDIYSRLLMARFFDAVFVVQKEYVAAFESIDHPNVFWLPLACDQDIHVTPCESSRPLDVGFVGQIGRKGTRRNDILTRVLPQFKTNDYLRFYPPREMSRIYGQSRIVFNVSVNGDLNMRFFEGMAAGALMVTDRIGNGLGDMFEEDRHYVGYTSVDEAEEKITYYLDHDEARFRIAYNGQKAVLAEHTYSHRWREIVERLPRIIHGTAPVRRYSKKELGRIYADIYSSLRQPWRLNGVISRYGCSVPIALASFKAWGRWLNSYVPLTPNAVMTRLKS